MNWSRLKTRNFAGDAPFNLSRSFVAQAELTGLPHTYWRWMHYEWRLRFEVKSQTSGGNGR